MNLISIDSISKSNGDKLLFENASFGISEGEKIALIGVNGCGKSTLFKILSGSEDVDRGIVSRNRALKISKLDQIPDFNPEDTILDHVISGDSAKIKLIKKYEFLCEKNGKESGFENELNSVMEEMERLDAWSYENEIKAILDILGIKNLSASMGSLSGGMIKKVALAQALIEDSNILLLDEPTNHLDIDTIIWLQEYLRKTKKAVLMITHDRYFLDVICSSIYEIDRNKLFHFKGNYQFYLEKKNEIEHAEMREESRVKTVLRTELEWLRRGPRARGTKSKARIDSIHKMVSRDKPQEEQSAELSITGRRLGKKILEVKKISKSYGENRVVNSFTYAFKRKEKIGVIGPNGSGKTTLLNILTEKIEPDSGKVDKGINTFFGYFDQHSEDLPGDMRLIDFIKKSGEVITLSNGVELSASKMLERFLFTPNLHYTPVGDLSGGEKRRLYLLHVLMKNPNFLILDEPTNDLDIKTLSILEDFLMEFPGCLIVVSHDRYFMDRTVDYLLVLDGNGNINGFAGDATDYLKFKKKQSEEKTSASKNREAKRDIPIKPRDMEEKKKLTYNEKRELEMLEPAIEALELEKDDLEKLMASGESDPQKLATWGNRYEEILPEIESKISRWTELSEKA